MLRIDHASPRLGSAATPTEPLSALHYPVGLTLTSGGKPAARPAGTGGVFGSSLAAQAQTRFNAVYKRGTELAMPEVGNNQFGDTMVHKVPRRNQRANPGSAVILSNDLTPIDVDTDRFIRDQMLGPFILGGRDIVAVPDPGTAVGADGRQRETTSH